MSLITLLPAYGRTYENKRDILSDWNAGRTFYILRGCYCSKRDLGSLKVDLGANRIQFRWTNSDGEIQQFTYWETLATKICPTTFVHGPLNGLI